MPQNKDLKRLVRARMAETGERYTQALTHLLNLTELEPLPQAWHITGSRAQDYEVGLLPADTSYQGNRVVQLRLRAETGESTGFGSLMQSINATSYLGRRVRFSAVARTREVTGWAGLWLRIDGPGGALILDNMYDRPLRQSTDWTQAAVVLDVPGEATKLHFGALLSGAGAIDLSGPRFEETDDPVTTTDTPLPDEPQALDFGAGQARSGQAQSGQAR